ncbi:ferritin-like domain-containing protein [Hymenobacter sp. 15J16-1T3B]|uniref:ferritin-like domain-containing protein n=1 Tax=Hymenobacter sp. 15J16-1T3B TaxID=2886941 RepID=UPI001D1145C4|nr:ferritin-like domain-containing protein [Hymenobacter sp. 15J16-1T3B]MCC3159250.1 ferritin-like domain-containing protein [Hymenobacter sp. 15J16-1T3B]
MNLLSFLEQLAAADAAASPTARRGALTQLAHTAAAALPAALLGVLTAQPAGAQTTAGTALDGLLLLLRVEQLQDEFYGRVPAGLVPAALQPDFTLIRAQQRQHIALLESYVRASGGIVAARPNYDFTGGRNGARAQVFPDVFTSTDTMLLVAQVLEDLSVRTYAYGVPLLINNNDQIDSVSRMFAVEGRHAAHLRQLRRQRGASVKSWISGTEAAALPTTAENVYAGEDRVLQQVAGLVSRDTSTLLPTTGGITAAEITAAATEAFDEPLSFAAASAIIQVFTY